MNSRASDSPEKKLIKEAVSEAIDEKFGAFYIDREKHYEHHQFLDNVLCYSKKIKGTACKTMVNIIIYGVGGLILLGIVAWIRQHLK